MKKNSQLQGPSVFTSGRDSISKNADQFTFRKFGDDCHSDIM